MGSQQNRIEMATHLALAGATIVTPNTRAARQLRLEAEWLALQIKPVCETPDVLPLEAWVARTWTECLLAGTVRQALLKPNVVAALWQEIVANSSAGRELMSHRAAAELAASAWQLSHEYKLPRSRVQYAATAETKTFFEWAETFEKRCAQEGWIDSAAATTALAGNLAKLPKAPKESVFFGFDQLTPLQQDLCKMLGRVGAEVKLLAAELSSPMDHVHSVAFADVEDELRTAALWARRKLEENPGARIGVIVPGLATLRGTIETIFEECLHAGNRLLTNSPAPRSFEISLGIPLNEHPATLTAIRILRLLTSGLPAHELSVLLRSRYLGGGTSEASSRSLLDYALRKRLRATVTVQQLNVAVGNCRNAPTKLVALLNELQQQRRKLALRMNRSNWAAEARRLLTYAGWPGDGEGEFTLSSEEFQVTSAWDSLLSSFGALDQVLPPRAPADLQIELERAAAENTFAAENQSAPIQIAGPLAVSGEAFDALWFCGLMDDVWPQRGHPNPFIPYALQTRAEMPHSSAEVNLRSAQQVTMRLLQSADDCIFSWPKRDEDREFRPSPLLSNIAVINRGNLPIASIASWNELQNGATLEEFVDEQAPPIEDNEVRIRWTSLLEWQSGCPFRAFAQVRLAAEPPNEISLGADARDRGKITELALQYVWDQFRDLQNLRQLTPDLVEHGIATAIDRALEEAFPKGEDEWLRSHRELERERLNALIDAWLDVERKREPFRNVAHQQSIEVKLGGLTIKGRADRIEQMNDGAYVILDYKTGGSAYSPNWWDTPRPQDPQLPIYAVAQRIAGREIAGVAFARVRTGRCGFQGEAVRKEIFGNNQNSKKYAEFEKKLESWQPELERLASNFLAGQAEVDPKNPVGAKSTCKYCHLNSLCRVAEFAKPDDSDEDEAVDDE
jgi:probable DNA repair protein